MDTDLTRDIEWKDKHHAVVWGWVFIDHEVYDSESGLLSRVDLWYRYGDVLGGGMVLTRDVPTMTEVDFRAFVEDFVSRNAAALWKLRSEG